MRGCCRGNFMARSTRSWSGPVVRGSPCPSLLERHEESRNAFGNEKSRLTGNRLSKKFPEFGQKFGQLFGQKCLLISPYLPSTSDYPQGGRAAAHSARRKSLCQQRVWA